MSVAGKACESLETGMWSVAGSRERTAGSGAWSAARRVARNEVREAAASQDRRTSLDFLCCIGSPWRVSAGGLI